MSMGDKFHCNKGPKIDQMCKEIANLNRMVITGNGGKSFVQLQSETNENLKSLSSNLELMSSNIQILMKFQTKMETARDIKETLRTRKRSRERWIITIIITLLIGGGSILAVILT
jgi:hypothetical protein